MNEKAALQQRNEEHKHSIGCLMEDLKSGESARQELHNFVQFLKGPMRVYCRTKPLQSSYQMQADETHDRECGTPRLS